jgi:hypothetical protein
MARLDPLASRSISFLFPRCQARLDGADLVVAVPSPKVSARSADGETLRWSKAEPVEQGVTVGCEKGPHRRADRTEYPVARAYAQSVEFRFKGGVWYGRVPYRDGWALCVQGVARSLRGLPGDWLKQDAVLVETSWSAPEISPPQEADAIEARFPSADGGGGPVNGPHLPYP